MSDLLAAAYHEAGHCYVAWKTDGVSVSGVYLVGSGGKWGGSTDIGPTPDNRMIWTTIGIAGLVAEAKAEAVREYGPGTTIQTPPTVVQAVVDYISKSEELLKTRKQRAAQIDFPVLELGQEVEASISRSDVRKLGHSYRDYLSVDQALGTARDICNDPVKWARIRTLAEALIGTRGHRLGAEKIRAILG